MTTALFWITAALLTALAVAVVLAPLLRRPRAGASDSEAIRAARTRLDELDALRAAGLLAEDAYQQRRQALSATLLEQLDRSAPRHPEPHSRLVLLVALTIALGLPTATFLLYQRYGSPAAVQFAARPEDGAARSQAPELRRAVDALRARLESSGAEDVEGWRLLGRSYRELEDFASARAALARAHALAPEDPELMIEYAEALALAAQPRSLLGEPEALLDRALQLQPRHQRGLWLKGFARRQAGDPTGALAAWEPLRAQLEPGSAVAVELQKQIDQVRQEHAAAAPPIASTPAPVPSEAASTTATEAPATGIEVQIELDPALADRVASGAVLFVYARAAAGPPMPLAVQRRAARELPLTVRLDPSMAMLPNLSLNAFPEVVVGARISNSGSANPASGDLEAQSPVIRWAEQPHVALRIDRIRP